MSKLQLSKPVRKQSGALGSLMLGLVAVLCFGVAAFAVDIAHYVAVQSELQNAADAAALAGAMELFDNSDNAESKALLVAEKNTADGRSISNQVSNTSVRVEVTSPSDTDAGEVRVETSTALANMFAGIFGACSTKASARAHAGAAGPVAQLFANVAYPIAVSSDAQGALNGLLDVPLLDRQIGDTFTLYAGTGTAAVDPLLSGTGTGPVTNASLTSFYRPADDNDYIYHAINQGLGIEPAVPGYRPSLKIGSSVNLASNYGVSLHIPTDLSLLKDRTLLLPVVSGTMQPGKARQIVGFMALKVTSAITAVQTGAVQIITGTIVKSMVPGLQNPGDTANMGSAQQRLSPSTIKLTY